MHDFPILSCLNHGFKFQYSVYCHDWSMLCLNISDIAIITVENVVKMIVVVLFIKLTDLK